MTTTPSALNCAGIREPLEASKDRVKLLLVDDDRDNLLALQAVLEPLNQELMLAESGTSALRLCLDHDFAAILLDVRMPEMDGFETAELIRSRKRSGRTPILFLTGYRSDEQLFRGYDLGAVDFLFKPIVPEILQSKVTVFVELCLTEQRMRAQTEALRRAEQKFRAVLEAAPDAMLITDTNGVLHLANSRTDSLFGYERDVLIGSNVLTLFPGWSASKLKEISESEGRVHAELRLEGLRRDGRAFPIEVTCSPFETNDGNFITIAVRDATEKVEAEERIQRVNADLERRVAERTSDLTRSNDALRQFAWAASHDLQEPVRMALSYSQWLSRSANGKLTTDEREMLSCVEENASRLGALLKDLRQYIFLSESEEHPKTLVDCNAVLRTALETLESAIEEAQATVEVDPLPTIPATEILLIQIFQNLISNSIKYRGEAAPLVRVSAEPMRNGWLFSISDNGIGIDPAQAEFVFGVFKRLHGRRYSGTGIGLAICKAAAERLGGRIWVKPEPGPGTTIQLFVPDEDENA